MNRTVSDVTLVFSIVTLVVMSLLFIHHLICIFKSQEGDSVKAFDLSTNLWEFMHFSIQYFVAANTLYLNECSMVSRKANDHIEGGKIAPSSWVTLKTVKRIKIPFNKQQNLMNIGIAQWILMWNITGKDALVLKFLTAQNGYTD